MKPFDPWTATFEEGLAHFSDEEQITDEHLRWVHAQAISSRRDSILSGSGRDVLSAVAECARHGLALPPWLADDFLRRFDAVRSYKAASWDDAQAFGPAHRPDDFGSRQRPTPVQLAAMHRKKSAAPVLEYFFRINEVPRTEAGRALAAKKFGLTKKQVKEWLPKTRVNRRGRTPDVMPERGDAGIKWQDPFGLSRSAETGDEGPLEP